MKPLTLGYLPLAKASWLDDRVKHVYVESLEALKHLPDVELVPAPEVLVSEDAVREVLA